MKTTRINSIITWALFMLGTACFVSLIFNRNVWMDEAFTANLVRTDMAGVLQRSMKDTLPPLYNILLKIITDLFGYTVPVMKLASVLPMIGTLLLGATVVRKRHGARTAQFFLLALTAMPCLLFFGIEIRMYSLGFFFATASGVYALEVLCASSRKNWILFTLFSVLAGYSHHFAFVTVGFVYLFLLLYCLFQDRKHLKHWFFCLVATFVLYLPCLLVTLKQLRRVGGYFSMPEVTFPVFLKYMVYPFTVGFTPLSILLLLTVAALFVLALLRLFAFRKDKTGEPSGANRIHLYAILCFLTYYGVLLFGTAVTRLMAANIFVDRYLFFAFGLLWLFFSIEAASLRPPAAVPVFLLVLAIGVSSYTQIYHAEYDTDPTPMITYLSENVEEGDALLPVSETEALLHCLRFYQPKLKYYPSVEKALEARKENGVPKTLWIAADTKDYGDMADIIAEADFIGVYTFDRYEFQLYRYDFHKK